MLFLFLHGFPDIPQEFTPIISHLQPKLNADYWILNGWSSTKCKISAYAEQVASFISESKAQFQYEKIFLVGHDFGGVVGWVVAEMLSKDTLSGFISFAPSPQVFAKSLRKIPVRKLFFYNLMKPLAGSTYLASKNFQMLDDLMTNETFWPEYRDEYHQMWDEVGAHALTCVYRENFDVVGGTLRLADLDLDVSGEDIETDVLLINGEDDVYFPRQLYHASISELSPQRGQQLYHKEVYDASHHSILHDHSNEVSHHIEMFARSVDRKKISLWSQITIPPKVQSSYYDEVSSDTTTFYVYIMAFVVMLTGLIMEITIGPMLVGKFGFGVYLFAQVMAATVNFGCFFAANLITLPLFTVGLFKMGYPEVTGHILGPIRSPEFYFHNKPFRVMSFIGGIAYIIHHTAGCILYMVVSLHEMNPLSIGFLALAVGFQHLVVFVKYRYKHLYSFLLIILEVWFQLESYYALTFATTSARVGISMLLTSHYIWLVEGIMQLIVTIFMNKGNTGKVEDPNPADEDGSPNQNPNRHTLKLYSTLNSTTEESGSGMNNEKSPLSASITTQRRPLDGINEEDSDENKNDDNCNALPSDLESNRSMLRPRSSMFVSQIAQKKSRLLNSDEVAHLMGFDFDDE